MSAYKVCSRCNRSLPLTSKYFNKNESSATGFQSYCKSCQKKQEIADRLKEMRKGKSKAVKKVGE